jgi:acyl carrier protein
MPPDKTNLSAPSKGQRIFPLSVSQQRLWIIDQLHPGITAYNISVSLRLAGQLNSQWLEHSLQAIVHRHETLRTTFALRAGVPVQIVKSTCRIPFHIWDLTVSSSTDLEGEAFSRACEELQKSFDLSEGPLVRANLMRLGPTNHILLLTLHHIISDALSAELFARELAEHYAAFSTGQRPSLKPLPMQYSEFAIIQRRLLKDGHFAKQLSYWRETLAGAPTLHNLVCDRERPEQPTYSGATETLRLDADLITDLREFARNHRATFFMLLTATFQVLLSKFSGQLDIVIGIPALGRTLVETEPLIGFFVNTIVLRSSLGDNPNFIEILSRVREGLLDAMAHQDVPFDLLVDEIGVPRTLNHNPIFQIMFATFRAAVQARDFGPLIATPYVVKTYTSRFDLSVNVIEGFGGTWWLHAEYSTDLFDRARIITMLQAYKKILKSILTNYDQRLSDLCSSPSLDPLPTIANKPTISKGGPEPINDARMRPGAIETARRQNAAPASCARTQDALRLDSFERKLTEIWQTFLNVSPINLDDDFFELGGNSLIAITLIVEVNRSFDKRIPVSSLFLDKTIRAMAKRLRGERVGNSSFVPLIETGTRPPLFAAGCSREYRDLSRALGADQPFYQMDVYALQEECLLAGKALLETVEEIAEHFVGAIRKVQPYGPYFLAGQCEGGIVALEIARYLTRQGSKVGVLMEFDTPVTGYFPKKMAWYNHLTFRARRQRGWLRLLWLRLHRLFRRKSISTESYIWIIILDALRAYGTSKSFDGVISVFRAKQLLWDVEDVALGWDRLGSLAIYDVPGDHVQMFTNKTTQRIIGDVLVDAQSQQAMKS